MTRSKVFELIGLATVQLLQGEVESGADNGHEAVTLVTEIRSVRAVDRLAPLEEAAAGRPDHSGARDLRQRIADTRAV
jgi:hypothetical protein